MIPLEVYCTRKCLVKSEQEYIGEHIQNKECVGFLDGSTLFVFKNDEYHQFQGLNVGLDFYINSCYNVGRIYTW